MPPRQRRKTPKSAPPKSAATPTSIKRGRKKNARAKAESELTQAKFRAEESFAAELAAVDDECRSIISSEEKKAEQLAAELLGRVKNGDL